MIVSTTVMYAHVTSTGQTVTASTANSATMDTVHLTTYCLLLYYEYYHKFILTSCTLCDTQSLIFADFSATSFASMSRSSCWKHKTSQPLTVQIHENHDYI